MSLTDDLAVAKAKPREKTDPIKVVVGEALYELVFEQAPGAVWAAVTARNPPRLDQPIDRAFGYNYHAVLPEIAALTGTMLKDGEPVAVTAEVWSKENPRPVNQWEDVFAALDGGAFNRVADEVFALNQWEPDKRTLALGKASRVGSVPSSDSPAS